jgi:hypothetical protein
VASINDKENVLRGVGPSTSRRDNTRVQRFKAMRMVKENAQSEEEYRELCEMLALKEEWLQPTEEETKVKRRRAWKYRRPGSGPAIL